MLSAQRKEFDEKKKDESPYPHDFALWYALDYFHRPRRLKARRFYVTFATFVVVALLSVASMTPGLHHLHQAAPVSKAHAMFNQNCATCHDQSFQTVWRLFGCAEPVSVSDRTCNECHHGAPHHAKQAYEPACATCHHEHRGHEVLANHVADRNCTACHGDLASQVKPGEKAAFHGAVTHFNRDHPEFGPSRNGKKDDSKIRFNHKAHLDLDLEDLRRLNDKTGRADLVGLGSKMTCVDCHSMDAEGKYPKPIRYDNHCARCHALNVGLAGDFAKELTPAVLAFSKTPAPHKEPAMVRAVLRDRFVEFAQKNSVGAGKTDPNFPRPLPWRPVTDEQWLWTKEQAKKAEDLLFMNKQWSKNAALTACAHCHIEESRVGGLPVYQRTEIPTRWYPHSVFNHGSHRLMGCVECHNRNNAGVNVAESRSTEDILLPTLTSCQECHTGNGGARNACVECHRYHDRAQQRSFDGLLKMEEVFRKAR